MGRVRTKTIKRAARSIVEKYHFKLTPDFQINKKITKEVAIITSKRTRNKVAGYVTSLMKRLEKAPIRGISLLIQEEERKKRAEYTPEKSEIDLDAFIPIDADAEAMLADFGLHLNVKKMNQNQDLKQNNRQQNNQK